MIFTLSSQMLVLALMISGIPLLCSALVGLIVSVLQAATSIQDQSISYVAKLIALIASFILFGDWFLVEILEFIRRTLGALAYAWV